MFYQSVLGGTLQTMLTYGESPMAALVEAKERTRISRATLALEDFEITGLDAVPGSYQRPQGFYVTLTLQGLLRASEVYDSLARDGTIKLPFGETLWSPGFGVLIDRFDIPWEINARDHKPREQGRVRLFAS